MPPYRQRSARARLLPSHRRPTTADPTTTRPVPWCARTVRDERDARGSARQRLLVWRAYRTTRQPHCLQWPAELADGLEVGSPLTVRRPHSPLGAVCARWFPRERAWWRLLRPVLFVVSLKRVRKA